jgi:hypothetical protein
LGFIAGLSFVFPFIAASIIGKSGGVVESAAAHLMLKVLPLSYAKQKDASVKILASFSQSVKTLAYYLYTLIHPIV